MTIQSILCVLSGSKNDPNAVNTALTMGKKYNACIRFLHISLEPVIYMSRYGYGDAYACAALLDACEEENNERLKQAKQCVVTLTAEHHVPLDLTDASLHHIHAKFLHMTGYEDDILSQQGRLSDLIIIDRGGREPNALYNSSVKAVLFNTGRPVILLPEQAAGSSAVEYKTVALAWKGTIDAARAMYNGMPFLERAEKVYVLTAEGPGETYDLAAEAALLDYLHLHGIHAQGIVVATGNLTPAEALLTRARELKADLLVMGAYGHSRFREMMLGGVTNHMLEKADIPLLLSH
jgi:nucleotide-binding universal stress UspA family protein